MNKTIALHFSYRMSYRTWVQKGFDLRERHYYSTFRSYGYDVAFITYDDRSGPVTTPEGIRCYGLSRGNGRRLPVIDYLLELGQLLRMIRKERIFILKANQLTGAFHAAPVKLLKGRKVIVRCGYNWMQNKLNRQGSRLRQACLFPLLYLLQFGAYLLADRIILSSEAQAESVSRNFPFFRGKTAVIRNHIDTDFYRPGSGDPSASILFVGRLERNKNVEALIRAAARADTEVIIVGAGNDDEQLKGIAADLSAPVSFTGQLPPHKVRDLMQSCAIFAFPSLYEGSPKALLEAMACGMVVVVADVVGCRELVIDGITGCLCGVSEDAIHDALQRAAAMDAATTTLMRRRAREFVMDNCSFQSVIKQELAIISRLQQE